MQVSYRQALRTLGTLPRVALSVPAIAAATGMWPQL